MKRIIHPATGATLWRGEEYLVDGQPGLVDLPAVILQETETAPPEYDPATQRLDIEPPVADLAAGQWISRSWRVTSIPAPVIAERIRSDARSALAAQWAALPPWIRGPFGATYAAAIVLLDAGDDAAAAALLEYAEPPSAFSSVQLATFSAVREALAAGIAALPPAKASL